MCRHFQGFNTFKPQASDVQVIKTDRISRMSARIKENRRTSSAIVFGVVVVGFGVLIYSITRTLTWFGKHVFRTGKLFMVTGALVGMVVAQPSWSDDWILRKKDVENDIEVYKRTTPEGFPEIRVVTHVNSRMSAFVAVLRDVATMPTWVHRISFVKVIEQASDAEQYAYTIHDLPWPIQDRDSVVRATLTQDAVDDVLTIRAHAVPDYYPRDKRYVRMPVVESFWRFTPLAEGRVLVEFEGYGDLGGDSIVLPVLRDSLAWYSTYTTVRAFREMVLAPEYQSAQFPFVREPR